MGVGEKKPAGVSIDSPHGSPLELLVPSLQQCLGYALLNARALLARSSSS